MTVRLVICGENAVLDADLVGCGMPILDPDEGLYRCTDCGVPFHKLCAKRHFSTDTPEHAQAQLTEQLRRLDERAATRTAAPLPPAGEGERP